MPLYEFLCERGERFERLLRGPADTHACPTHAGARGLRCISGNARPPSLVRWGSDFQWTPDMRDAHEEAMGYKHEAQAILKAEGIAPG